MNKAITFFTFFLLFNISSSHPNTNLPIRCFSHDQFLVSKYSSILHALLDLQSHVLEFHNPFHKNPNHLILYTHTDIHQESIFTSNYIHFHLIYVYAHTIHVELKIL